MQTARRLIYARVYNVSSGRCAITNYRSIFDPSTTVACIAARVARRRVTTRASRERIRLRRSTTVTMRTGNSVLSSQPVAVTSPIEFDVRRDTENVDGEPKRERTEERR
jgi:hypothetical protein